MLRPPFEPIILSYWARFRSRAFNPEVATALVSALSGVALCPRNTVAVTKPTPGTEPLWVYPDPDHAAGWLDRLYALDPTGSSPLEYAAACFAETVRSHPYTDGNGRLGRAFFHGALAQTLDLPCPIIPLGPAMYAHAPVLTASLRAATIDGDWPGYFAVMRTIVATALELCDH